MSIKIRYPLILLTAALTLVVLGRFANKKTPHVVLVSPESHAAHVNEYATISATLVNLTKGGINEKTLTPETVFLS